MTCRPHHTACPGPEACTCEGLARPTASPDCPYVMHGHVPPPVDDISALEVLQDLSSWVGWGGLSASPTDYTAQEWGARIRAGRGPDAEGVVHRGRPVTALVTWDQITPEARRLLLQLLDRCIRRLADQGAQQDWEGDLLVCTIAHEPMEPIAAFALAGDHL